MTKNTYIAVKGPSALEPYCVIRLSLLRDGQYDYVLYKQRSNGGWFPEAGVRRDQAWNSLVWLHWGFSLTENHKRVPVQNLRAIAVSPSAWPEMRSQVPWRDDEQ